MLSDVRELTVFIASPGDLEDERAILRGLESDLNSKFAPAGIRIRMTGWEERPPAYGRPQQQINPMVDACDLFIGLLRRKWGTETGLYASGFEEEFERALMRRENTGELPEISMFFSKISQGELEDAGPSLSRVMEFQRRFREERIGIYSFFDTPEDLRHQADDLLQRHLLDLILSRQEEAAVAGPKSAPLHPTPSTISQVEGSSNSRDGDSARSQISRILNSLNQILSDEDPEYPLDRDRFELLGTALGRDDPLLQAHLVNRLYGRRGDLRLIVAEHTAWVRSLMADVGKSSAAHQRVIPGWAVIDQNHSSFEPLMLTLAAESGQVGIGTLKSMQRLGFRPASLWPSSATSPATGSEELNIQRQTCLDNWTNILNRHPGNSVATDYLLQDVDTQDPQLHRWLDALLNSIETERGDLNGESKEFIASTRAAMAGRPQKLADALGYSDRDSGPWRLVLRQISDLDGKRLNQLASQRFNDVARVAALREGVANGALTDATLTRILFDGDEDDREILMASARSDKQAAQRLLKLLEDKPEGKHAPDAYKAKLLAITMTPDELRAMLMERRLSNEPWEALTYASPSDLLPEARAVLETNAAEFRSVLTNILGAEHEDLVEYMANDRKRAAASLLARQGVFDSADIALVLDWFDALASDGFVPDRAFDVLEGVVSDATLPRISALLTRHKEAAGVRLAYDRVNGPLAPVISALFITDERGRYRAPAASWNISQESRTHLELVDALYDEDDSVRTAAAQALTNRLPRDELEQILNAYPQERDSFWYNVVAYLDEHLYGAEKDDEHRTDNVAGSL